MMNSERGTARPITIGSDTELYNAIHSGNGQTADTGADASRRVLRHTDGVPDHGERSAAARRGDVRPAAGYGYYGGYPGSYVEPWATGPDYSSYDPLDHSRKYSTANGGCTYIDSHHVELCTPETNLAREFVALFHANLRTTRKAAAAASAELPEDQRIVLLANNVDSFGHSYGGHMNFHISKRLWHRLVDRSPHTLLKFLTFKVSSIVYTGQGRVALLSDNKAQYQLTQRGLEMKCVRGVQTMYDRPLFNERDEAHCDEARLHDIFYDTNLAEPALYLKAGVNQIMLAMFEEGAVGDTLTLDEPLYALRLFDCSPSLTKKARLIGGEALTAVEIQLRFFEQAQRFVESGRAEGYVPEAMQILEYWGETLELLEARDFDRLSRRLDWVLKKRVIEQALDSRAAPGWASPQVCYLDMLYSSLDPAEGIYYQALADGFVDRLVTDDEIDYFQANPPSGTRAWGRTQLLRQLPVSDIVSVNWDAVSYRVRRERCTLTETVKFPSVHGATEADLAQCSDEAAVIRNFGKAIRGCF